MIPYKRYFCGHCHKELKGSIKYRYYSSSYCSKACYIKHVKNGDISDVCIYNAPEFNKVYEFRKETYYGKEEFYKKLYNRIKNSALYWYPRYYTIVALYEIDDIVQMSFLKCFQPREFDNIDLYERYLNQPFKDWDKVLGARAVKSVLNDLLKNNHVKMYMGYPDSNISICPLDEESYQLGYTLNDNYIDEFIHKYGDNIIKDNITIREFLQDIINGHPITNVCKKFKINKNKVIEMLNNLDFKSYLNIL